MIIDRSQPPQTSEPLDEYKAEHNTIKSLHRELRPREKALSKGISSLTVPELWALILGSGTRGINVVEMCNDLMARNDFNLTLLARRNLKQIASVKGLGPSKALQIMATLEIAKRYQQEELPKRPAIACSEDAYKNLRPEIAHLGHEEMWIMMLNRANHVIKLFQASRGTTTATIFDLKGILKEALLENAEGIIMAHNHPSGNCRPSGADDSITLRCHEGCRMLDIRFLDHIIVTPDTYFSYKDEGKI